MFSGRINDDDDDENTFEIEEKPQSNGVSTCIKNFNVVDLFDTTLNYLEIIIITITITITMTITTTIIYG